MRGSEMPVNSVANAHLLRESTQLSLQCELTAGITVHWFEEEQDLV